MSLTIGKLKIKSANFNGVSSLPPLAKMINVQQLRKSDLAEDAGFYFGYGFLSSVFPYLMQDQYDRDNSIKEYTSITLENKYIKAVILPEFGGRVWSLYDKERGRDIVYENPIVRPCNIALRNAWLAGGIEYNCGMVGHSPFTCDKLFAATTKLDDGTPVLRLYTFERIRRAVYQMDFFLPEDSRMLFTRIRITNTVDETIPMYWWTNVAVNNDDGNRIVTPCNDFYTTEFFGATGGSIVVKKPAPIWNGVDITYQKNTIPSRDFFWNLKDEDRKFLANVYEDGYAFVQTSTSRLKGRKLFTWGQLGGAKHWNEFLTDETGSGYTEVQMGLARSQYECLPMAPLNSWEWLEAYGAIQTDPKLTHGEWTGAVKEVEDKLNQLIDDATIEKMLKDTKKMALTKADKIIFNGQGWGALENMRRELNGEDLMCPHLDFGTVDEEQKVWVDLLKTGTFSETAKTTAPISWMKQPEWTELVEKAEDSYIKYLHLTVTSFACDDLFKAKYYAEKLAKYEPTPLSLFVMSQIEICEGNHKQAGKYLIDAHKLSPNDISLARETYKTLCVAEMYEEVIALYENATDAVKADGRDTMYYAYATFHLGDVDKAYHLLYDNGGLLIADIREGEISITSLCLDILEAIAKRDGKPFDRAYAEIPLLFDFRTKLPSQSNY